MNMNTIIHITTLSKFSENALFFAAFFVLFSWIMNATEPYLSNFAPKAYRILSLFIVWRVSLSWLGKNKFDLSRLCR
jgi:hypothetical protein